MLAVYQNSMPGVPDPPIDLASDRLKVYGDESFDGKKQRVPASLIRLGGSCLPSAQLPPRLAGVNTPGVYREAFFMSVHY
jgi:hypothetical protein